MARVLIENPVINSPFAQHKRHFRFDDEGITSEIIEGRRPGTCLARTATSWHRAQC